MTSLLPPVLWGLVVNLLLQVSDGILTYKVMKYGVPEANPLVRSAIASWGVVWGLVFWKGFACVLLLLIFTMRYRLQAFAVKALALTAAVYGPVIALSFYELVLHLSR
jgi:Domain of unknown function (DUF5658)